MQSLRSELVYGEADYVKAFSDGRQLPDFVVGHWCDCIDRIVGKLGIACPTLADLGCGDGRFTLPLAQRFRKQGRVLAIDKSRPMLERLRVKVAKSNLNNVNIILDDIFCCIPCEKVHVCFASEVVHSFRWDPCVFENMRRMSSNLGTVVLRCQTEAQARQHTRPSFFPMPGVENTPAIDEMCEILASAGFPYYDVHIVDESQDLSEEEFLAPLIRRSYAFLRLISAEDYSEGMRRAREYASGRSKVRCESKWTCLVASTAPIGTTLH
jgi:SAM-dependent methyltransferase